MKHYLKRLKYLLINLFNIFFRPNVYSSKVSINAKIGIKTEVLESAWVDKNSIIGNYTFIATGVIISKSTIGNYCSIAPYVKVGLGEHNLTSSSTSARFLKDSYAELTKKDCLIGNDVWIGANACILRGVIIGNGAVVGANAVVTKDVPPFAVVVGIPSRIIKYRFNSDKIQVLMKSKWWLLPFEKAKIILNSIENG